MSSPEPPPDPDSYESTYAFRARFAIAVRAWLDERWGAFTTELHEWATMIALKKGSRR